MKSVTSSAALLALLLVAACGQPAPERAQNVDLIGMGQDMDMTSDDTDPTGQ